jgi:hypothetical protein
MSLAVVALWIAGGAVMTVLIAAAVDVAKRQRAQMADGRVLFEARSAFPFWVTFVVGAALGATALFSQSALLLFTGLSFFLYWPHAGRVLLRVHEDDLEHLPVAGTSGGVASYGFADAQALFRIRAVEVRDLEWDGFDNIGIRLRDGSVASVNFRLALRDADREPARRAVLAFVERATSAKLPPPERPRDVARWMVRESPASL